jgi:serpin B
MLLNKLIPPAIALFLAALTPSSAALQLADSHAQFAFSLYPTLDSPGANLAFSPYCISTCLSMVYLGARGDTESQMQKTLHWEIDRKNIAKATYLLSQSLLPAKADDTSYRLNIANAVWVDQGTFLLADFCFAIEEQFKARLGKINFAMPSNALSTVNTWVSEQTKGKITDLLTTNDINAQTRLVLTNAVYFQGSWTSPFDPKATQDWPFHPTPDSSVTVKMMHQKLAIPYYENELMQAAAIPFTGVSNGGGTLGFVILLPKSAENFTAMLSELPSKFSDWISSLSSQQVELKLPKFIIDTRLNLGPPLQQLGMEDAFDSNANFVGIDGMRDLFLNQVIHQAFFALDENGVVAAAATAASMNVTSTPVKTPPVQLAADHPFLFFIVDLKSQEMLFMGKVAQPDAPAPPGHKQ